jgi:ankyrin repeat protein
MTTPDSARPLPSNPNLEQYKKQAKELLQTLKRGDAAATARAATHLHAGKPPTLADAQHVLAREHGFESWPKFKRHIEAMKLDFAGRVNAFLDAVASGNLPKAQELLAQEPGIATANIYTAAALGEAATVEAMLRQNPALATAKGGTHGWEPILYAAISGFHRTSKERGDGICRAVRLLLEHGASPDTSCIDPNWPQNPFTAIYYATGRANHPALARILLEAGANPNDGESAYHSAEYRDNECLKLLMEFKVRPGKTNALKRKLDYDDLEGARLMLEYGFDPNEYNPNAVHHAIMRGRSGEFIELLAKYGADLYARTPQGLTPYEMALGLGNASAVAALERLGAAHALTPTQQFLAACAKPDEAEVRHILAEQPDIMTRVTPHEMRILADAAMFGRTDAVRVMLDAGFPLDARGDHHATPLHWAAWQGHQDTVLLLIERGAPLDVRDASYQGTPLGWALHGSVNSGRMGDYPAIVDALLKAGAPALTGEYVDRENLSPLVMEVLQRYGIR